MIDGKLERMPKNDFPSLPYQINRGVGNDRDAL
jgi:hypothetical protein